MKRKTPPREVLARAERDARDLEIINRNAEWLNREALYVLNYQAPLGDFPDD